MGVRTRAQLDVWSVSTGPTFHGHRPVLQGGEDTVAHRKHVLHHVDLGQAHVGEVHLVWAGHLTVRLPTLSSTAGTAMSVSLGG